MKHYYVYIVTNWNNKVLYTGITNNLLRRAYEHKDKMIEGFTKRYKVDKLVYFEHFHDVNKAINGEKKVKGWRRDKKIKLIESLNPNWEDLTFKLQFYTATSGVIKDPSPAERDQDDIIIKR